MHTSSAQSVVAADDQTSQLEREIQQIERAFARFAISAE